MSKGDKVVPAFKSSHPLPQDPNEYIDFYQLKLMITSHEIRNAIHHLAHEVVLKNNKIKNLTLLGICDGGLPFSQQLQAELGNLGLTTTLVHLTAKSNIITSPDPKEREVLICEDIFDPDTTIKGREVLICEDIIDTGKTIQAVLDYVKSLCPSNISIASLLYKKNNTFLPDYHCFTIPNHYVVGYGLDYQGHLRSLPAIYRLYL